MNQPQDHRFDQIAEGAEISRDYTISSAVYEGFLATFGDQSPIHVDDAHARGRGFTGRVMHGAILNGFLSHFVGMHFPGRRSLLLSADLRYAKPSYLGDVLTLTAKVTQKVESQRVVVLSVHFFNQTRNTPAATGRVQVAVAAD